MSSTNLLLCCVRVCLSFRLSACSKRGKARMLTVLPAKGRLLKTPPSNDVKLVICATAREVGICLRSTCNLLRWFINWPAGIIQDEEETCCSQARMLLQIFTFLFTSRILLCFDKIYYCIVTWCDNGIKVSCCIYSISTDKGITVVRGMVLWSWSRNLLHK